MNISNISFSNLLELAHKLISRNENEDSLVIPIVGAGASACAEIPTGEDLKKFIYKELTGSSSAGNEAIQALLDTEAKHDFKNKAKNGILNLSLFEFAAVVSKIEYGRLIIDDVVKERIEKSAKRTPLCYELLAHLTKHHYIDHFLSLNFDELLDKSLMEEIPNRLRIISGADDLPGSNYTDREKILHPVSYLMKPFGSLDKDKYKLTPKDVKQFGDDSLWKFCLNRIFTRKYGNVYPHITMILVGYAAGEEAFEELLRKLNETNQRIVIYAIKNNEGLSTRLEELSEKFDIQIKPIAIKSEVALLLLNMIIEEIRNSSNIQYPNVSICRHEILSNCINYEYSVEDNSRFETEVILQAIKSRGFFTIESIGDIKRISNFSKNAREVITKMTTDKLLVPNYSDKDGISPGSCTEVSRWSQDFNLNMTSIGEFAETLLKRWGKDPEKEIVDWSVCLESKTATFHKTTMKKYLKARLEKIGSGVEIEIRGESDPSSKWLFYNPSEINSIAELGKITNKIFKKFLSYQDGTLEIFGVWSTGEWLFHEKGYAYKSFGKEIITRLNTGEATLDMVTVCPEAGNSNSVRNERNKKVHKTLSSIDSASLGETDWWRLNRRLTLLRYRWKDGKIKQQAIYFRRRISTPLVSPIKLSEKKDCAVIYKMFCHYWKKTSNKECDNAQ